MRSIDKSTDTPIIEQDEEHLPSMLSTYKKPPLQRNRRILLSQDFNRNSVNDKHLLSSNITTQRSSREPKYQ